MLTNTLVDVPGFKVGHATNLDAATGCTVVICPPGTVGGVDVRGGAPGTRETDLLQPYNRVEEVTAVVLSGGSAFGLASAQGVVQYLEERGIGYKTGSGFIVLAATLSAVGDVPVTGLALILGIDRFMSEARALTNLIGNGVATVVVGKWTGDLDTRQLQQELDNGSHEMPAKSLSSK